ncbi:putative pectin lyase/virulence factor [Helianthus anomalus]
MPTQQLVIRRLTCISPMSAVIALGSEMSGIVQDVRAEDIIVINSESGVQIKTGVGRGGFVKDIYVKGFTMHTMKWAYNPIYHVVGLHFHKLILGVDVRAEDMHTMKRSRLPSRKHAAAGTLNNMSLKGWPLTVSLELFGNLVSGIRLERVLFFS